jgi:hypothetical protein
MFKKGFRFIAIFAQFTALKPLFAGKDFYLPYILVKFVL